MRRSSLTPPALGSFSEAELDGLPEPARRYLRTAIAADTPLARSARFRMRGSIKLGKRWVGFRARQVLAPHHGFVWSARAGGIIVGSDRYADGRGVMDWKIVGLVRVAHGGGPDLSRSAAGRAGAEAVWVPTALLPRFGVAWTATGPNHIAARYRLGDTALEVRYTIDEGGYLLSLVFDRWGDPDRTSTWSALPFGFKVTGYGSFDGVTIPCAGRVGWFFGTERWSEGEFFRFEITDFHLVTEPRGASRGAPHR